MRFFGKADHSDRGASIVEYALIVGVISLMSLSAVTLLGERTETAFTDTATALDAPGGGVKVPGGSGGSGGSGDAGSGGSGSTTTTMPATTTTTLPPTTTTTTLPPTTTTTMPPTTTTTAAPKPASDSITAGSSQSSLTSWKETGNGGHGDWTASVSYTNKWGADQYLTLQITRIDESGNATTVTVPSVKVPAGSSATYNDTGNALSQNKKGTSGVLEVRVEVVSITTGTGSQQVTYPGSGEIVKVSAPSTP